VPGSALSRRKIPADGRHLTRAELRAMLPRSAIIFGHHIMKDLAVPVPYHPRLPF
jgi:hypothetical protein